MELAIIAVDPYMPEYRLEAAKCYADDNRLRDAVAAVRDALELDDTLAAGWALLGLYRGQLGQATEAAAAYRQAATLDPEKRTYVLDAAYNLVLSGELSQAQELLLPFTPSTQSEVERWAALAAEIQVRRDNPAGAVQILEGALSRYPTSAALSSNRARIDSI